MTIPKQEYSHSFQVGDCVRLMGPNHWKGTLHGKKSYKIAGVLPHHICVLGDTGELGWFAAQWFEISNTGVPTMGDGASEYEEIMAAQEMVDGH